MKKIVEEVEKIVAEAFPFAFFVFMFGILIFSGGLSNILDKISIWMFGQEGGND